MNETDYENGMMWMNGPIKCTQNAIKLFTRAANNGCEKSQLKLTDMYLKGKGVAQDKSMAMNWYRKAAEQGHANVQYNIGVLYEQGKGGLHQRDDL